MLLFLKYPANFKSQLYLKTLFYYFVMGLEKKSESGLFSLFVMGAGASIAALGYDNHKNLFEIGFGVGIFFIGAGNNHEFNEKFISNTGGIVRANYYWFKQKFCKGEKLNSDSLYFSYMHYKSYPHKI